MFILDKLLTTVLLPTALMAECLLLGALLGRRRAGRPLLFAGACAMAACLLLPVDDWAIRPREDRSPAGAGMPAAIDGIVVRGGAIDDLTSRDRGTPTLNSAADRMTTFVALSRRYPRARLVFTGGSGDLEQGLSDEARYARILFAQLGLPPGRVTFEAASRTTWENALDTASLVRPKPGERWVLLTSASHMPRAVGVFRRVGWSVLPWPVGYQSRDHVRSWGRALGQKLSVLDWAAHEWIGLAAYYLQGRSSALFPGPLSPAAAGIPASGTAGERGFP